MNVVQPGPPQCPEKPLAPLPAFWRGGGVPGDAHAQRGRRGPRPQWGRGQGHAQEDEPRRERREPPRGGHEGNLNN